MKFVNIIYLLVFIYLFSHFCFGKKLNIITSVPDIKVMCERIGGKKIKVQSLATGKEDLHGVPVKPSFLPKLRKADLVISLGLSAEHAWLPALTKEARNSSIIEGNRGWKDISSNIPILSVPKKITRAEGEQHPEGNPHYNINPPSGFAMAKNVLDILVENDSKNEKFYTKNYLVYSNELRQMITELKAKGKPLEGVKVVGYHENINYFCKFYGMHIVGFMEVKHGVPPTPKHFRELVELAKKEQVQIVFCSQSQQKPQVKKFADKVGATYTVFYDLVGTKQEINTWQKLQRYNLNTFLKAVQKKK